MLAVRGYSLASKHVFPAATPSLIESLLVTQSQPLINYLRKPGKKYIVLDLLDNPFVHFPILESTIDELQPKVVEMSPSLSIALMEIGYDENNPVDAHTSGKSNGAVDTR